MESSLLWLTLLPPLVTIVLVLLTKEVYSSLIIGIIAGIFIIHGVSLASLQLFVEKYLVGSLTSSDNVKIIVFSMCIGGIAHLINKNGGIDGVVSFIERKKRSRKEIQFYAYLLGLFIFFDDYANTLITGNAMRRLFDKYGISREKLAFIVDATSAPITSIAFVTTWIGFELSQVETSMEGLDISVNAYQLFLGSLKFAFYPILMLLFTFLLIRSGKDYGMMKQVEDEVKEKDVEDEQISNSSSKAWRAIFPVTSLIVLTLVLLLKNGFDASGEQSFQFSHLGTYLGKADSFSVLLISAVTVLGMSLLVGGVESLLNQTSISFKDQVEALVEGFKTMLSPVLILILAWCFGGVVKELGTGDYIASLLKDDFPMWVLPVSIFLVGALIAFSTGSSFGTMSILYPVIIPIVWMMMTKQGAENLAWLQVAVASVLGGAVFGDHCSPISDTTIMSSMASEVDHIAHVKTQLPYALFVGGVTVVLLILTPLFF